MVHGIGNKGNLNLLYNWVKIFPWPLASYKNKRSYCSIENLIFIINELILQKKFLQASIILQMIIIFPPDI